MRNSIILLVMLFLYNCTSPEKRLLHQEKNYKKGEVLFFDDSVSTNYTIKKDFIIFDLGFEKDSIIMYNQDSTVLFDTTITTNKSLDLAHYTILKKGDHETLYFAFPKDSLYYELPLSDKKEYYYIEKIDHKLLILYSNERQSYY